MDNKLFVGNISWNATKEDLQQLFEQVGEVVEVVLIMDKMKNRHKGFGFVTMATDELAQAAIEKLNDYEMDGRQIKVSVARPPKSN